MIKKDESGFNYGIGNVLKTLRLNRHITQAELAEKIGVSINAIKQYENNIRQPRYDYLLKLTDFFNVESDFFKAELHYKLDDIKKYNDTNRIPQFKKIFNEESFIQAHFKTMMDDFIENNTNSTHVLFVLNALKKVLDLLKPICVNSKRKFLFLNRKKCDNIENDYAYYILKDKEQQKSFRDKPLSELEFYKYRETIFDENMEEIHKLLKEIMYRNFKEDYVSYKNNFKKISRDLKSEERE